MGNQMPQIEKGQTTQLYREQGQKPSTKHNTDKLNGFWKTINVFKAIHWNEMKASTTESCFRDAGFPLDASLSFEKEDPGDDIIRNELVERLRVCFT